MAKKAGAKGKVKQVKHARIELSPEDYAVVEQVAHSIGLGVAAYVRMAVLQRARRDKAEMKAGTG
jgi:hypothetical protein